MLQLIKKYIKYSNNLHSLAGNVLYAAFSLITFLLMVRLLNKELYGQWIIYITTASLLDMFRLGLAGTGAIRLISTSKGNTQKQNIAASYQLSVFSTILIAVIFIPVYYSLIKHFPGSYYMSVLLYYPILAFANLPYNQANILSQGIVIFKRVMILRSANGALSLLFIGGYILFSEATLQGIILVHILANLLTSLPAIILKWDGMQYFRYFHKQSILKILNFGKYSTASFVGGNLLRSSDTFILSMSSVMGAQAIAIYAIPLKFIELVEIPLRSFTATAFPKLSQAWKDNREKFNHLLKQYLTITSLLLFPVIIALLFFSGFLLQLIGGNEYADNLHLQKTIVYIVAIYIFLLPFDRYSGVALFAINKPDINFLKIMIMLVANIIFDLIAVFVFQSLILVTIATVLFTLVGICVGWYFISRNSGFTFSNIPMLFAKNISRILLSISANKKTKKIQVGH